MSLTRQIIQSTEELRSIVPEWSAFVRAHRESTPFHLPEWLLTWWEHFGSGRLQFVVFRSGGSIRALLPCFLLEWKGRLQLTPVGAGITDYLDPLVESGWEEAFVGATRTYLEEMPDWAVVDWTDLAPEQPLFNLPGVQKKEGIPTAEIPFHGDFESYWSERGKDLRRNLRRYRDRAEQTASVQFESHAGAEDRLVEKLLQLHTARWQSQGEPGMVEANHSAAFLRDVARRMASAGFAKMFVLRFADEITALVLAFPYQQKIFAYMSAFDPDQSALGFGRTLLYEALRDSYSTYAAWNFLRGDEPYKLHWGAQMHPRARLKLERPPSR